MRSSPPAWQEAGFDVAALHAYIARVQHALTLHTPLDLAAFRALGFGELLRAFLAQDATGAVGLAILFPTRDLWTLEERQAVTQRLTQLLAELGVRGSLTGALHHLGRLGGQHWR